jgi:predicted metal-dependent enzyme (double-stranded beta helix superfamily)
MSITIEQFGSECRALLAADPGPDGVERVRRRLEDVLVDEDFQARHLGPDNTVPRKILYEDAELGFCILAHVNVGPKESTPHDHGPAWAIYGQVTGETVMTDWRMVEAPDGDKPGKVEAMDVYTLNPGMARTYGVGDLHSPSRTAATRLIRIESQNMDAVERDAYEAV